MASERTAPRDFGFGSDEEMLRDLARKFLDEQLPVEKLRTLVAARPEDVYEEGARPAWDEGLWKQIVELGWTGLAVPEPAGGLGVNLAGVAGLLEEVGRHALPSPLPSTLQASFVLRELGEPAHPWLARIADGTAACLAVTDERGSWEPTDCGVRARDPGDGLVLSGAAHFVQDAFKADLLVVSARLASGVAVCAVPADAAGVRLAQDHIHDLTRDQATVHFDDVAVPAANVVSRDAESGLHRAWPALLVSVAADLCGTAEWQLQTTTEYARARKQFDRSLGFFQAVKHPLVNAMVEIDRARSLLYHAASSIDASAPDAEANARMAKSAASDAGAFVSDRSVQLHGGIGFTWECDVHLYFKRSLHAQAWLGDGVHQRRKLADLLIGEIGAE
ncbi:MAG: acyl-CoA dehydrogenase family protein [Myxococcota bacterium]